MRSMTGGGILLVALAAAGAFGCTSKQAEVAEDSIVESEGLSATMGVETGGDVVRLTLHVTNTSGAPIQLEFTSGQRYEFQVARVDGDLVGETLWTWSMDKSFMQALGRETLEPGGSLRFTEEWTASGQRGEFVGIGRLTSTSHPVQQSVRFELAGDE